MDARRRSKHTDDIGAREVVADVEKSAVVLLCDLIGEAVAKIETGGVNALSPSFVNLSNATCSGRRDADDFNIKVVEQRKEGRHNIASRTDDKHFRM